MRAIVVASMVLALAACGSENKDRLPDDLTAAEGVERPEPAVVNEPEEIVENEAPVNNVAETVPPPATPELPKPSFDCGGTLSSVEALICNDPELARLDQRLSREYARARSGSSPEQRQRLSTLGQRYLGDRDRCTTRDCVVQAYRWYLRDIETMMGWQNP